MDALSPAEVTKVSRQRATIVGLAVLLLAFGLRIFRIDGPYEHFDEVIAVWMSQRLEKTPGWDTNWKTAEVPGFSFVDQYNFSAYIYGTHLFRRAFDVVTPPAWWEQRKGLIVHRIFSVLCGTIAVGFVMLAAFRMAGTALMLGVGLLAALNPQLVQDAHYARPEAFMTLLAAMVVWLGLRSPVTEWTLGAMAFLVGLLVATKVGNGVLVVLPAMAAWQYARERGITWRSMGRPLALLAAALAVGWAVGVPYALVHWGQYMEGLQSLSGQYSGSHPPHSLPNYHEVWPLMGAYFLSSHGLPLLLAIGVGAVYVLGKKAWVTAGLLVLPLLGSVWLFGSQRVFFERNLSMVIPGALLLAGLGFQVFVKPLLAPGRKHFAALLAAVLLASLTGDKVVLLLLREGVTDVETTRREAFVTEMKSQYEGMRNAMSSLYSENDVPWLRTEVELGKGELLLFVWDFNDAYKARWIPFIADRFQLLPVGEYRGTFADYPTSTLGTMHGCRIRAYIVRSHSS